MHKHLSIFLIVLLFTGGSKVLAQHRWSLNECIEYAIENNLDLRDLKLQQRLVTEDLHQSQRDMLPGLSASSSAGLSFGRSVDPNTDAITNTTHFSNSYSLSTSISIFNGFRMQNRIKFLKYRKQAAGLNQVKATDDLAFEVMGAFFNVVYFTGMQTIAEEQIAASKLNLKTTEHKVKVGLKAKTDLLEMRANLEMEELNRIKIVNNLTTANLHLKQLMNFRSEEALQLADSPTTVAMSNIENTDALFAQFAQWSPQYQALKSDLAATQKNVAMNKGRLLPSLSANGGMRSGFYETNKDQTGKTIAFGEQIKDNRSKSLGASLSIPIFAKWSTRSDIKKAKLELERAKNNMNNQRQKLYYMMVKDIADLEALYKEYNQYSVQAEVDEMAFKAAEKKFDQGLIDINAYYIAKNRLANSQSSMLRSRTQWEIKMKTLDFYNGVRFWESAQN